MTKDQKRLINELAFELEMTEADVTELIFRLTRRGLAWPEDAYRLSHAEASEMIDEMVYEKRLKGEFYD